MRRTSQFGVATLLVVLLGLGLVVAGAAMLSTPAALILAGAILAAAGIGWERGRTG